MKATLRQADEKRIPCSIATGTRASRNDDKVWERRNERWARTSATVGAAAWAGVAVLAGFGIARLGAIELIFLFAPLVIVPLAMELGRVIGEGGWLQDQAQRLQPVGAALAVLAMLLSPGRKAGVASLGWVVICVLMAAGGVVELARILGCSGRVRGTLVRFILAIAKIDLGVGGAWLVASRLGMRPMGIQEPIGLLTAVHFHYAGFATATIAAATLGFATETSRERCLKPVALLVAVLPFLVAAGFVVSPALKMFAALLFSASVAGLAIFLRACGREAANETARVLLQVAAGAVFAGMVLSGAYAIADFVGSDVLAIPQMARTHGILNAVGFCLPGLLGWIVETSASMDKLPAQPHGS